MSPRFAPDLSKVSAGFPTLESGEWEFVIGEAKPFWYVREKDSKEVAGVRYPLKIVGPVMADGSVDDSVPESGSQAAPMRVYVHSEAAFGMLKQFFLAALGWSIDEEDEANEEFFSTADFDFEPDEDNPENDPEIGEGYRAIENRHIRMTCSVELYGDDKKKSQQYGSYVPV